MILSGQALFIRSCHEDVIFTRKSHNCAGTAFVQGDSAGGSKLTEQTLNQYAWFAWFDMDENLNHKVNSKYHDIIDFSEVRENPTGGGGGTLSVEVISMLIGNFLENPKNIQILILNP